MMNQSLQINQAAARAHRRQRLDRSVRRLLVALADGWRFADCRPARAGAKNISCHTNLLVPSVPYLSWHITTICTAEDSDKE